MMFGGIQPESELSIRNNQTKLFSLHKEGGLCYSNSWSARKELSNELEGKSQEVLFQKNHYHVTKGTGAWRDYQFETG